MNKISALYCGICVAFILCDAAADVSANTKTAQIPKTGMWEQTTTVKGQKPAVEKICVTEEDLSEWLLFKHPEPECKETCKIGGGLIDCTSSCKYGKTLVNGSAKGTYDATSYKLDMQATSGGKPARGVGITGKYLSPNCLKPK